MIDRRNLLGGAAALAAAGVLPGRALATGEKVFVNKIVLEQGRVWIAAMVEGKGPYFFVVDTGSGISFIEDDVAKSMGLAKQPGRKRFGIGGGVSDYSWYIAREVRLASGIRFPDMVFAGTRSGILGKDLVGGFGSGLFTSYDSDFDFVKGEWRAWPDGRPDRSGMEKLPSRFLHEDYAPKVAVDVAIDGFEGPLVMDTGASPAAVLTGRAAEKSGLWDDGKPYAPARAEGFGSEGIPSRVVRAGRIRVGTQVIDRPLVMLNAPGTNSNASYGLLGLATLSRFHLSTRVSDGSLWIAPNGIKPGEPGYRLSGLWLEQAKGRAVVDDVGTGSPAFEAGIRKGDVLAGEFAAVLRAINGGPGKQVALTVERGGAKRDVTYTLRPWL